LVLLWVELEGLIDGSLHGVSSALDEDRTISQVVLNDDLFFNLSLSPFQHSSFLFSDSFKLHYLSPLLFGDKELLLFLPLLV
jgi:hypothetical protein